MVVEPSRRQTMYIRYAMPHAVDKPYQQLRYCEEVGGITHKPEQFPS
jgi:hypothetical protein